MTDPSPNPPAAPHPERRPPATFQTVAYVLLTAAAAWFLLRELAPVLRPLLIAVLLAYVLMPTHSWLRTRVTAPVSIVLLAVLTAGAMAILALVVYTSVLGLSEEIPGLQTRAVDLVRAGEAWIAANVPWLARESTDGRGIEGRLAAAAGRAAQPALGAAADAMLEAGVAGLYLVFLLLEASRFPDRVRRAYSPSRADEILQIAGQVNSAIVSYLRAKVRSSLILAVPVGLILWAFGVRFALLWAVLTFLCNFIPYVGSVVAYALPVGFAFLQLGPDWRLVAVAALLLGCQVASASLIEPMLLGRAVGLSPLAILASLAFWGLLWGLPGMFLAVPLTVLAVIVMGHFQFTRPVAELVSGK